MTFSSPLKKARHVNDKHKKMKMFDAFLGKITEKLKKASPGLPILPPKLYKTYLEMDLAERELIDLLALQITYNSSEV